MNRLFQGNARSRNDPLLTPGVVNKVVIEDKNRRNAIPTALMVELDRAMVNRGADVGLGILVNPNATPLFYQGNKVLVNLADFGSPNADYGLYAQVLRVGYDMARFIAISSARRTHQQPTIDLHALKSDLDGLATAVQKFSTLKDNHTCIETAVTNARSTADQIREHVVAIGGRLRKRITEALKMCYRNKGLFQIPGG